MEKAVQLLKQRRYQEALQEFLNADVPREHQFELSYYLGICYTHLEKYDEALIFLEQVLGSRMSFPYIYQSRMIVGYIYTVTSRLRLAELEFMRLLDDGYESAKVYAALAYVTYHQRKTQASVAYLEKALRIDPQNATALNSLAYILAEGNTKLDVALSCSKKAVARNPENAAYLDTLGWVYYRIGRLDDAVTALTKALARAPENEEIAAHLEQVRHARMRRGGTR